VQFALTNQGTHTFILLSDEKPGDVRDPGARSAMEWPLHTFVNQSVTLRTLNKTLLADEESWFWAYRQLEDEGQQQRWTARVDRTLGWLHAELFAPVQPMLRRHRVKRLVVVPHRGLHLTPLGAW
jgi:hypothetical protein